MVYQAHDVIDVDENFYRCGQHYLARVLKF